MISVSLVESIGSNTNIGFFLLVVCNSDFSLWSARPQLQWHRSGFLEYSFLCLVMKALLFSVQL